MLESRHISRAPPDQLLAYEVEPHDGVLHGNNFDSHVHSTTFTRLGNSPQATC